MKFKTFQKNKKYAIYHETKDDHGKPLKLYLLPVINECEKGKRRNTVCAVETKEQKEEAHCRFIFEKSNPQ